MKGAEKGEKNGRSNIQRRHEPSALIAAQQRLISSRWLL
jgi:hypothetical protein